MKNIVLNNVTLVAIVRDEMINPAGGIEDFVNLAVPFVEKAVIVDTGSIDGTREKLEELEIKYRNLRIYDREFDNYVNSRNYSLSQVSTDYVLVLDADERFTRNSFRKVAHILTEQKPGYCFRFLEISPKKNGWNMGNNPRLFRLTGKARYDSAALWETLYFNHLPFIEYYNLRNNIEDIDILHFVPDTEGLNLKLKEWYMECFIYGTKMFKNTAPSSLKSFKRWKEPNPKRKRYI